MEPEIQLIVISDHKQNDMISQLENITIPFETKTKSLGTDDDFIVYDGYEYHYDEFKKQFDEIDELSDVKLVKKGSSEAPGMYKLGSTEDIDYTEF